jgi:2Fe-2S ferredoxin
MARLTFEGHPPFAVEAGVTLLEACEHGGVPMTSACGGFAACNSCRVQVVSGASGLTPQVVEEEAFLDGPAQRLGCQARVVAGADVVLRLAPGT